MKPIMDGTKVTTTVTVPQAVSFELKLNKV